MKSFPTPVNLMHLQQFLGFTSYCQRFIKDYAKIVHPCRVYALMKTIFS